MARVQGKGISFVNSMRSHASPRLGAITSGIFFKCNRAYGVTAQFFCPIANLFSESLYPTHFQNG